MVVRWGYENMTKTLPAKEINIKNICFLPGIEHEQLTPEKKCNYLNHHVDFQFQLLELQQMLIDLNRKNKKVGVKMN